MKKPAKRRVILYGLGQIGTGLAKVLLGRRDIAIVGAVDIARDKVGRNLGEVLGVRKKLGIKVSDNPESLLSSKKAEIVLHTTLSSFRAVFPQLEEVVRAGVNVSSSTEELLYPNEEDRGLIRRLDRLAREHGVTVLGTGVNPGFAMDLLPLVMTGVCTEVKSVSVTRVVDASKRRRALQAKVGSGMMPKDFRAKVRAGEMGHAGLMNSLRFLAGGLGLELDTMEEKTEPVIAKRTITTRYFKVKPGQVAGIDQIAQGLKNGRAVITLRLKMFQGAEEPYDAISVKGNPPLDLIVRGGIEGDMATAGSLLNSIERVIHSEPGFKTMMDLPVPRGRYTG